MHRAAPWLFAVVVPGLPAQDVPSVADMTSKAHALAKRLSALQEGGSNSKEHKQDLAAATKAVDDFVEPVLGKPGYSLEHYVQISSPFLEVYAAAALKVAEAGLKHFPDSRFLYDHAGAARLHLAVERKPCKGRLDDLRAAEQSFRKALTLQPETFHAHVGLAQTLDLLGQQEEALRELDLAAKAVAAAKEKIPQLPLIRACMLLRANKPADALALLQSDQIDDETKKGVQILVLRAHALAGDAARVAAQAKAMEANGDPQRAALEHADALLWMGKKAEALKLLAKKPAVQKGSVEENEQAVLAQSYAALEQFAGATDFGASSPLRAALTKALGHAVVTMMPGKDGKTKEVDLSGSPVMMSHLLMSAPVEPIKQWGNRLLLVLCLKAAPAWKPGPEENLLKNALGVLPGPDDMPAVLLAMRYPVGDPDEVCGLASLRAAEKLQDKPAAPKKQ